ncbi:hypothetical protein NDU88_005719 [Pleurodeles waltl]|uniref:Uncharacterized protein n=1 Tax=Pleurodeles waltl TaxID=8319 RepID=A0AAV7N560_PLEWA|nr:hypothetical protein NDU88_005719 [Pleurodeles waltl]
MLSSIQKQRRGVRNPQLSPPFGFGFSLVPGSRLPATTKHRAKETLPIAPRTGQTQGSKRRTSPWSHVTLPSYSDRAATPQCFSSRRNQIPRLLLLSFCRHVRRGNAPAYFSQGPQEIGRSASRRHHANPSGS